jgi:hypothetical protein
MESKSKEEKREDHREKMERLCRDYGVMWTEDSVERFLGISMERLRELYEEDPHLNNIPLKEWDALSYQMWVPFGLSLSERVSMLKHAVIKLI